MISPKRALSEIRKNFISLKWWRDRVLLPFIIGPITRIHPTYPGYNEAVHVMDKEWDTLIILDACRADIFEEVVDIEVFDSYSRVASLGSHSSEWTRRNFVGRTLDDTVYVSANPHTTLLADGTFYELIEVWKKYEAVPNEIEPSKITDISVSTCNKNPDKRLIIHFMQPHSGGLVTEGESREQRYRLAIRRVMDQVFILDEMLDGKTVITADHGELFNTGIRKKLGFDTHVPRLRFPELVNVPCAELNGNRRNVTTGTISATDTDTNVIEERLRDLGYYT
jgi:hypothetical protein